MAQRLCGEPVTSVRSGCDNRHRSMGLCSLDTARPQRILSLPLWEPVVRFRDSGLCRYQTVAFTVNGQQVAAGCHQSLGPELDGIAAWFHSEHTHRAPPKEEARGRAISDTHPSGALAPPGFQMGAEMGAETRAHAWLRPEDSEHWPMGLPEAWQRMWHLRFMTVPQSQASLLTTAALQGAMMVEFPW